MTVQGDQDTLCARKLLAGLGEVEKSWRTCLAPTCELCIPELFLLGLRFLKINFIYFWLCRVFMAAWVFSSCGEWGLLFVVVCWLIAVAALVDEHRL